MSVNNSELATAIRDALDAQFRPGLVALLGPVSRDSKILRDAEAAWERLGAAIASGVANYLFPDPAAEPADPSYVTTASSPREDAAFWAWVTQVAQATNTQPPTSLAGVLAPPTRPTPPES